MRGVVIKWIGLEIRVFVDCLNPATSLLATFSSQCLLVETQH